MAQAVALLQQLQHVLTAGHNFLAQARHVDARLAALMDLQLRVILRQQVIHLLIVQLRRQEKLSAHLSLHWLLLKIALTCSKQLRKEVS